MGSKKRSKHDSKFKMNAVHLSNEDGRTAVEVALTLGIAKELLYKWRHEYAQKGEYAFPGNGIESLTPDQRRIKELERAVRNAEMERDILKKAVAIFSKVSK